MGEHTSGVVQRIIDKHGLNPAIEKRPPLRRALGISQPTQWRHERKHDLAPIGRVGESHVFETAPYLTEMLGLDREDGAA